MFKTTSTPVATLTANQFMKMMLLSDNLCGNSSQSESCNQIYDSSAEVLHLIYLYSVLIGYSSAMYCIRHKLSCRALFPYLTSSGISFWLFSCVYFSFHSSTSLLSFSTSTSKSVFSSTAFSSCSSVCFSSWFDETVDSRPSNWSCSASDRCRDCVRSYVEL